MNQQPTPYRCHVFVCTNDRQGTRKSCADGQSTALRETLKAQVEARGWKPQVRVSACGCMGLCGKGPNVMLYPQGFWFSEATPDDAETILQAVETSINH